MSAVLQPGAAARGGREPLKWSYRVKVPLALTLVALLAGIAVATGTYLLVYRYVEANALAQTQRLARTLARSLVQPVLSNDVWQAFQTVRASSLAATPAGVPSLQIVVIDAQGEVFVALDPGTYPIGTPAARLPAAQAQAAAWVVARAGREGGYVRDDDASGTLLVAERLIGEEDALIGGVIVQQEHGISRAQARGVARQLALLGAAAILLVGAVGWVAGRRMIRPLEMLRAAMRAAPSDDVRPAVSRVSRLNDEVGELGRAFLHMMDEIRAKQEMERHMQQAERMASIGQLSAGIAHEVNNPLGGMLAAIENRRLRGSVDEATERTMALLERGLRQVHDTVQALLNEARSERHPLASADLHDLELLLRPEAEQARCTLDWRLDAPALPGLPAVPVRQVVLNLTLNAIAAAGRGGRVRVWAGDVPQGWEVRVGNTGAALSDAQFAELVSGSARSPDGRLGLGLWITARILHALGGRLRLDRGQDHALATVLVAAFVIQDATTLEAA
jgi:signal transduction histidine kinase